MIAVLGCACETYEDQAGERVNEVGAPVAEESPEDTMVVQVYFNNNNLDPEITCEKVFATEREIPATLAVGTAALDELLAGPTKAEQAEGYYTNINSGVTLIGLKVVDGVAFANFDSRLEEGVAGSCRVIAIRSQITETLKQFPTVDEVIISVEGRTEDILQP